MPVSYDEYIKRPGTESEYSPEMIDELIKCKEDIKHFLKYVKIISLDKGRVPFEAYPFQMEMLELFQNNRLVISTICRQAGKTTICAIYALWYAIFHPDKWIGIASNKAASAKDFLARIKLMYEELPEWLKCGVKNYAVMTIEFENGSKITSVATTADSFRGRSCNLMILDELGFIRNNLAQEFWMANYPAISSSQTSRLLIVSTPNGIGNLFHELFSDAERNKNSFVAYRADYTCVPGRDEKWYKEQEANLGVVKAMQELKCQFLGSTTTVVNTETLERLFKDVKTPLSTEMGGKLRIYEKLIKDGVYVAGADASEGTGGDDAVLHIGRIISMNPIKIKRVATFQDNFTDTHDFAQIIYNMCTYYNDAYVAVESNSIGNGVISRLWWDFEYENVVNDGGDLEKLGVKMTKKTKPIACLLMKKLLEEGLLDEPDEKTVKQLAAFVNEKGKMQGNEGTHDDLVSALYLMCYILKFDLFDESMNIVLQKEKEDEEIWGILGEEDENEEFQRELASV